MKGKQRLTSRVRVIYPISSIPMADTSQALVKIENEDYEKKPRSRITNHHLPLDLMTSDIWTKKVLLTLFHWLAAQANPWVPVVHDMEKVI